MLLAGCEKQPEAIENEQIEQVETGNTEDIKEKADKKKALEDEAELREKKYRYEQNEAYKMFYGTWEYTEVVSQYRNLCGDEGYEELIGTRVSYFPTAYRCNKNFIPTIVVAGEKSLAEDNESDELIGTQVKYLPEKYRWNKNSINYLNYIISMIPQTEDPDDPNFKDWMQFDMKELISDELYYIGVQIANKPEDTEGVYMGTKLLLKGDNTMYALEDDCIYELKRVEYIEGHDPYDIISYQIKR